MGYEITQKCNRGSRLFGLAAAYLALCHRRESLDLVASQEIIKGRTKYYQPESIEDVFVES